MSCNAIFKNQLERRFYQGTTNYHFTTIIFDEFFISIKDKLMISQIVIRKKYISSFIGFYSHMNLQLNLNHFYF